MVMVVRSPRQNVLHSIHRQATRKRVESLSALDWQKVSDNTSHYGWTQYSKIIPLWDEMFEGRILYLPYDLQFSDPQEFVRRIVERLEPGIVAPPVSGGPQGESGHSNVPLPIVRLVAARTQPDVEFLRSRFPDEFMALCQT